MQKKRIFLENFPKVFSFNFNTLGLRFLDSQVLLLILDQHIVIKRDFRRAVVSLLWQRVCLRVVWGLKIGYISRLRQAFGAEK